MEMQVGHIDLPFLGGGSVVLCHLWLVTGTGVYASSAVYVRAVCAIARWNEPDYPDGFTALDVAKPLSCGESLQSRTSSTPSLPCSDRG